MTYQQGMRLATRTVTIYLLVWALSDLIGIPREIASVIRETHTLKVAPPDSVAYHGYLLQQAILWLAASVLRTAIWLTLALWFYRCGPTLQRFFTAEHPEQEQAPLEGRS